MGKRDFARFWFKVSSGGYPLLHKSPDVSDKHVCLYAVYHVLQGLGQPTPCWMPNCDLHQTGFEQFEKFPIATELILSSLRIA